MPQWGFALLFAFIVYCKYVIIVPFLFLKMVALNVYTIKCFHYFTE